MRVSIIGSGYVGLVTSACLAEKGHQVICVDVNQEKVDRINRAIPPIHEDGLADLLKKHANKNLCATTDLLDAILTTELTLIAVGTPFDGEKIDLTFIKTVSRQIGAALKMKGGYHLVVVKSTVVPGTTDEVVGPLVEEYSGKKIGVDFGLGMNPEFLTEGVAIRDFMHPDRIVLGGVDQRSLDLLDKLYAPFTDVPRVRTNNKTAELIKYTSNALLATMISFSNEIAGLCTALGGVDVADVMGATHLNHYLSKPLPTGERFKAPITSFLEAGCGFGGSCLPKDAKALIAHGRRFGKSMQLLDAVIQINERQPQQILVLLKKHFPTLANVRIAILGLAFKPDTDDMRESPAIPIIKALLAEQAKIQAYDPIANGEARKILDGRVTLVDTLEQAITNVDAIVLVTRWNEFQKVPALLTQISPPPVFIDGRRMLDKRTIARYEGIGL